MPPHPSSGRLIDRHAAAYDITNSHVVVVDAEPAAVLAGVDRLPVRAPVPVPGRLLDADGSERVYATAWRGVQVVWDLRVTPGGESGAVLSATTRFVADDEAARDRLLSAWATIGPLVATVAKRGLAAIKRYVEEQEEPAAAGVWPSRRLTLARAA
jgi:hypothetical protein